MWEKIILDLISNGFKFTFQGSVEFTLLQINGNVILVVEDTASYIRKVPSNRYKQD